MDAQATRWRDGGVAAALATGLGAAWTIRGWPALAMLHLPDTDDVMRLQQVRDWIDGQAFGDVSQHRLGTGLAMHWSRVADLGPAEGIETLTPLVGRHAAELATVILWPLMLFAVALFLVARIARMLDAPPATAALVASIAYPATTIFLPGRIDHHGLQVVLLLGAVLALLGPPTRERGVAIGLLAALSIAIGLETTPLFLAIGAVVVVRWIVDGARERPAGLAIGGVAGLCLARVVFASDGFAWPACDGFTLDAWRAGMIGGIGMLALATLPCPTRRIRLTAATLVAATVAIGAVVVAPRCLSPYGAVDPMLARIWLANVQEAQSVLTADPATAIGYIGLSIAGIGATAWCCRTRRDWAPLLVVQIAALAVTAAQLRGAYAGAMLAAPALAATIDAARRRGGVRLVGAWLASAGMLYPLAAQALPARGSSPSEPLHGDCTGQALVARLATLPPGTVMAPIDAGAYLIAATPDRLVAAPYHRNGPGDLASFAFYGGTPAAAKAIAHAWRVDYVVACAAMPAGAIANALDGRGARGFARIAAFSDGARLYRVR